MGMKIMYGVMSLLNALLCSLYLGEGKLVLAAFWGFISVVWAIGCYMWPADA